MQRSKTIFLSFTGKPLERAHTILQIKDGYECWNLNKISLDGFVDRIKEKIPPVNDNVLCNYKIESSSQDLFGITEEQYGKCSWGLLIPETLEEGGLSSAETMFLLNLYSPSFLYPVFHVNDMGIMQIIHDKDFSPYYYNQDGTIFCDPNFVSFYKLLFEQSKYGSWHLDRIQSWDKEDWRLFVAALLFSGLKDYVNSKNIFGWQRESAEMVTILEALFTAGDSQHEEVSYRLRKRIAVLLAWMFPSIEEDIKELYKTRSAFVHGSFFQQIARESPRAHNNLPVPDFKRLYIYKEYVRFALVAYLNLARIIRSNDIQDLDSVMNGLERAIIDLPLRERLIAETRKIIELMPPPKFK